MQSQYRLAQDATNQNTLKHPGQLMVQNGSNSVNTQMFQAKIANGSMHLQNGTSNTMIPFNKS
jgi:hypothetical protein